MTTYEYVKLDRFDEVNKYAESGFRLICVNYGGHYLMERRLFNGHPQL